MAKATGIVLPDIKKHWQAGLTPSEIHRIPEIQSYVSQRQVYRICAELRRSQANKGAIAS